MTNENGDPRYNRSRKYSHTQFNKEYKVTDAHEGPKILVTIVITLLKVISYLYELISWPIYSLFSFEVPILDDQGPLLAAPTVPGDPASPWRSMSVIHQKDLNHTMFPSCTTLNHLMERSVKLWPKTHLVGTRQLLKVEMEKQPNGREFKKVTLGPYVWQSYEAFYGDVRNFSWGLGHVLGLKGGGEDKLLIFCETRSHWLCTAQACFRMGLPLVTLYATLGDEALVHGVDQSLVRVMVTSDELLPKVMKLLPKMPSLTHVIYIDTSDLINKTGFSIVDAKTLEAIEDFKDKVAIWRYSDVVKWGQERMEEVLGRGVMETLEVVDERELCHFYSPVLDDLAVIMYTSGSTGLPKGVLIAHRNFMTSLVGMLDRLPLLTNEDCYIAYLPLAHVLELCCELILLSNGVPIGYGSPLTLTDNSSKVKSGTKGDMSQLQPTLMACVPTILDRLHKAVWQKVTENGAFSKELFRWALQYKRRRLSHGFPSILLDRLVFGQVRKILGGRVRLMLSGGAPLSEDAQQFVNACFCRIVQGYGLTETCGAGTLVCPANLRTNHAGEALSCLEIKLRPWEEGRYFPHDLPLPRGEVLIGGDCVTMGYYKMPEKTAEDFVVDPETGRRWFCTGDVGQFHHDGTLAIVDRKKDLVKLRSGEYVSLGKVELALGTCGLVETICVYGDGFRESLVALVVPNKTQILTLVKGGEASGDFTNVCAAPEVVTAVLKQMGEVAREKGLSRTETPVAVYLEATPWLPDSGLVTDSLKIKRKALQEHYQHQIDVMYASL